MAWTRSPLLLAIELLLFAAAFYADAAGYVPLSKTPVLLAIAWLSLRLRGIHWKDVGLRWPAKAWRLVVVGSAAGVVFWAFEYFVENPVLHNLTGQYPDLSVFRDVVGNLALLAVVLLLNLVLAAFGEELVWRGYALPRIAAMLGESKLHWLLGLVLVNVAFGAAHAYQGQSGMVQASVAGILLGLLYLATQRNLVAPIAAHFTANLCDFLLIYAGVHVGLGPDTTP